MGRLKPGATYTYEYANGITYAREQGAPPESRFEIGRDAGRVDLDEHVIWNEVRQAARTNPSLRRMVDRVIIMYKMSEEYERKSRT